MFYLIENYENIHWDYFKDGLMLRETFLRELKMLKVRVNKEGYFKKQVARERLQRAMTN